MNKIQKFDQSQLKKQLQNYNSSVPIDTIIKVSSFLMDFNLQLIQIIGGGALSIVFKGYDDYNSRDVAVKIMINQNSEKKKQLDEEIKILRLIKSEYVVKIFEHFYDEQSNCIMVVMEYCQHGDLHTYFKNKKDLEKEELITLFTQFLLGLQDIHKKGIFHSDLKPQNILLADNNKPKICDIGQTLQNNKSFTPNKGGAPVYQPYEYMCGQVRLESDYYSAGAVLCFLCNLEIESDTMMAFQLKSGLLPDIKNKKQKEIIEIGFEMMKVNALQRVKPQIAYEKLFNLLKSNSEKIRSQTEQKKKKQKMVFKFIQTNMVKLMKENGQMIKGMVKESSIIEMEIDMKNGQGTYFHKNGNKHVGQYLNDQRNGQGTFYFTSGAKYEGEFKNGKQSGQGTHFDKDGNKKYVGQYQNSNIHGKGVFYYNDAERYEGEFENDQKSGLGTYYYKNGDKYVGQWYNGKKNGEGILYCADGTQKSGFWKADEYQN